MATAGPLPWVRTMSSSAWPGRHGTRSSSRRTSSRCHSSSSGTRWSRNAWAGAPKTDGATPRAEAETGDRRAGRLLRHEGDGVGSGDREVVAEPQQIHAPVRHDPPRLAVGPARPHDRAVDRRGALAVHGPSLPPAHPRAPRRAMMRRMAHAPRLLHVCYVQPEGGSIGRTTPRRSGDVVAAAERIDNTRVVPLQGPGSGRPHAPRSSGSSSGRTGGRCGCASSTAWPASRTRSARSPRVGGIANLTLQFVTVGHGRDPHQLRRAGLLLVDRGHRHAHRPTCGADDELWLARARHRAHRVPSGSCATSSATPSA